MNGALFQPHMTSSRAIIVVAMLSSFLLRLINPTKSFLITTIRQSRISGYYHHRRLRHRHLHRPFNYHHHPFTSRSTTAQSNTNDLDNSTSAILSSATAANPCSSSSFLYSNIDESDIDSLVSHAEYLWDNRDTCLTQTHHIPTIIVPVRDIHDTLTSSHLKDHLASPLFEGCHPPIKLVRQYANDNSHKLVLLHPSSASALVTLEYPPGPTILISIPPSSLPPSSILQRLLPPRALPPPSSFEQIGSLLHFNLKERHDPFRKLIGNVFFESLKRAGVTAVINKRGAVGGRHRTYDFELLACDDDSRRASSFDVTVNEHGIALQFDLRRVYWNSRLAGDRQRLLSEFEPNDLIADAFCGVGALLLHAAKTKGCRIVANDLNPAAVTYCRRNAKTNLPKRVVNDRKRWSVSVGDGRDFIRELGMMGTVDEGDRGMEVELPRHLVMNYPSGSTEFLDALRWWPAYTTATAANNKKKAKTKTTTVHVYTFARGDSSSSCTSSSTSCDTPPPTNGNERQQEQQTGRRTAEEVAVDMVAEGLLPQGGATTKTIRRREFLDKLGCRVRTREVRDVAPGKVVVCVSFEATGKLIRHMQGDFVDV